ncbi:MAG: hypothetical protein ABJO09_14180 [Hyphomicrobiales bacterium]
MSGSSIKVGRGRVSGAINSLHSTQYGGADLTMAAPLAALMDIPVGAFSIFNIDGHLLGAGGGVNLTYDPSQSIFSVNVDASIIFGGEVFVTFDIENMDLDISGNAYATLETGIGGGVAGFGLGASGGLTWDEDALLAEGNLDVFTFGFNASYTVASYHMYHDIFYGGTHGQLGDINPLAPTLGGVYSTPAGQVTPIHPGFEKGSGYFPSNDYDPITEEDGPFGGYGRNYAQNVAYSRTYNRNASGFGSSPVDQMFSLPSYDVLYNSNFDTAPSGGTYSNGGQAYSGGNSSSSTTYSNGSSGYSETSGGRDAMDSYGGYGYGNSQSNSSYSYGSSSSSQSGSGSGYNSVSQTIQSLPSNSYDIGYNSSFDNAPSGGTYSQGSPAYNSGSSGYSGSDYGDGNTSSSSSSGSSSGPILIDLDDDGLDITSLESSNFYYDMDGDGQKNRTAWAGAGDGVLVRDAGDDGVIELTEEVDFTSWAPSAKSDLEALRAAFDTNNDDKLNSSDTDWALFKVLVTNVDGTTTLKTLAQLGITELDLISNNQEITLEDGSKIIGSTTYTKSDNSTGIVGDVQLAYDDESFIVAETITNNADGSTTIENVASRTDGTVASTITTTTSTDGNTRTTKFDTYPI